MYRLEYQHKHEELVGDLLHSERGDPKLESITPHGEWYSPRIRKSMEGWGPKPRVYPVPAGLAEKSLDWKRERVIAVAARFLGYGYQHHHIPDWDPPADWPWKKTCVGHNGKGVDCSNFTSFVYNQGFGVKMSSAIERQSELKHAEEGGEATPIERVSIGQKYAVREKLLRTGDLLYIRGREDGPITHVVLWVGSVGRSPGEVPLIIDSHGAGVTDEDGQAIPCGVRVRPFREDSWYNRCASHAHRIFR
ncbi:MAG TPA: NlpC/P60 family protein [Pirellulales bacterium]|jgi:cell wall-associated NlpC family hydrolase